MKLLIILFAGYRIINLLATILFVVVSVMAWRRSHRTTWLIFVIALLLPLVASIGVGTYSIVSQGRNEAGQTHINDQIAKAKIMTGEVAGFLSSILYLVAGFGVLKIMRENNTPNHGLESTGAPPAAGTPETHP